MADGSTQSHTPAPRTVAAQPKCGVVIIGHGDTATSLLAAARALVPGEGLDEVIALDAGAGKTPEFEARVCEAIERAEQGRGVLLIADLMGSSPCMCGLQSSEGHGFALLTGLNLAMLTKLALADRHSSPRELADDCAGSVHRSICVKAPE